MARPLISVLLAIYNAGPYITEAVESILSQSLDDFELIIVDDGSTDGTWEKITDFSLRDHRIVAIRNETNLGTAGALNRGLSVARGDFITRQDGDDISKVNRLHEQVQFLKNNPKIGAVGITPALLDETGAMLGVDQLPLHNTQIQKTLLDKMCFCGPSVMCTRRSLERAGNYFDENLSYSEDYDLCLRLAEVTEMANLEQPLYLYRQHGSSVSHSLRHVQLFRKARALQGAILRRYPTGAPQGVVDLLARDYFRSAVLAFAAADMSRAVESMSLAREADPQILSNSDLIEETLQRVTSRQSYNVALDFIDTIFSQVFPQAASLSRLRSNLIAKLHIRELFNCAENGHHARLRHHLAGAIRNNPSWLLNRGVLSLLLREVAF